MADTPPPVTAAAPASCNDDLADDLFVSAIAGGGDSPTGDTDSGLFGVHTDTESAAAAAAPADASVPAASTPGGGKTGGSDTMEDLSLQDDIPNSEIPLDDDPRDKFEEDDLFQSVKLEPEPSKQVNGRESSLEPTETDIPLEDDDEPYNNPHLQLSSHQPATLSSFQDLAAQAELEGGDEYIEVKVTEPHKVGDGMSSFMAYKVTTTTNLSFFKKKETTVTRRFSDFLGLRDKLSEKYLQNGRIIPPAPDKSVIGMTKIKMSKEEENTEQSDFVEKRRAALERYLNRTAGHQSLRVDPDFREFLELETELPKSNQTSTLSGKSVMKMFTKVGDRVNSYTTKMEETDAWFEEKTVMTDNLDTQLRKLLVATEALVYFRKSLTGHTYTVAKGLGSLGSAEENTKLSAVLDQLSEVYLKVEKIHEEQAKDDYFLLSELVHDYIGIVGAVKDVLNERVKAWQAWQGVQKELNRKREAKMRAELAGKLEKVNEFKSSISETERQLDMAQENFEKISRTIKKEFELFEAKKNRDFKHAILAYLEKMLKAQESLVMHWERFLPEIKKMEV